MQNGLGQLASLTRAGTENGSWTGHACVVCTPHLKSCWPSAGAPSHVLHQVAPLLTSRATPWAAPLLTSRATPWAVPLLTSRATPWPVPLLMSRATPWAVPLLTSRATPWAAPLLMSRATPWAVPLERCHRWSCRAQELKAAEQCMAAVLEAQADMAARVARLAQGFSTNTATGARSASCTNRTLAFKRMDSTSIQGYELGSHARTSVLAQQRSARLCLRL